jgi:transposase-like protein
MHCPKCDNREYPYKKFGFYTKISDDKGKVQRYQCKVCKGTYSDQTGSLTYMEKKPHLTQKVMELLMGGMSQRSAANILKTKVHTVSSKMKRLGIRAKVLLRQCTPERATSNLAVKQIFFDEMETFEHTKCKPISIFLAVEEKTRKILDVDVAPMPAKGKLSAVSRHKYGIRPDGRRKMLESSLSTLKDRFLNLTLLKSDQCPRYRTIVENVFGDSVLHQTYKGRRGCVVGQGELKRGGFDPLFSLNHTCAMFRCRIKRLSRRTWCTTKKLVCLEYLIQLYAWWHNERLTRDVREAILMP